jgi:4-amino-4-deoxychorismate lyase
MFRFFESIAILNGQARNLNFHQFRIDQTFKKFYPHTESHHLEYLLAKEIKTDHPLLKCKFSYNDKSFKFYTLPYKQKSFQGFQLIRCNNLQYDYKFTDRSNLDKLTNLIPDENQIIIVRNNLLTDSTFSNLIFFDNYRWLTPAKPLLEGTMRSSLLAELRIYEELISTDHLHLFKSFKLINALNSIDEAIEFPVSLISNEIKNYI